MKDLFTKSKRQRLVYIILFVWVVFGFLGFAYNISFSELAQYFGTFAAPVLMYIWGETKRPHDS